MRRIRKGPVGRYPTGGIGENIDKGRPAITKSLCRPHMYTGSGTPSPRGHVLRSMIFAAQHCVSHVFLSSHTSAMGRFMDVVWRGTKKGLAFLNEFNSYCPLLSVRINIIPHSPHRPCGFWNYYGFAVSCAPNLRNYVPIL